VTNKYCDVPFTKLRGIPFSLPFKKLIAVKVAATNAIKQGDFSDVNTTGVTI
jgi:hypothetical protein